MILRPIPCFLVLVLLGSGCVSIAPDPTTAPDAGAARGAGPLVARGGYRLDLGAPLESLLPTSLVADPKSTSHFLVQFDGPVRPGWKRDLERVATQVHDYLPDYAFLATLSPQAVTELRGDPHVRAVVPYPPALKIDPAIPTVGVVGATVLGYSGVDPFVFLGELSGVGAVPTAWAVHEGEPVVDVTMDAARVADVARLEDVAWVELARNVAELDNEVASAMTQSGQAGAWSVHDHGVDGGSQVASVCDTGVNTLAVGVAGTTPTLVRMAHEAFDGSQTTGLLEYNRHLSSHPLPLPPHPKIALYYSPQENGNQGDADDDNGHGTFTAGTIAGDAAPHASRSGHDGLAFASRLAVCDAGVGLGFTVLNDYDNYWKPAYDVGARVSSNSWGTTPTNNYTIAARQQDAYTWQHRDFVLVRSMGNGGPGSLMRPEAAAKNVVAVGATLNDGLSQDLSSTSSVGPAADGRIKPNVVAPGRCLVSSSIPDHASYDCYSGTSAATPVVAGAAVLVRDYFARGFYPSGQSNANDSLSPSAALVRAVLEVSGLEISGDRGERGFPNGVQGWGRPILEDALYFSGDASGLWVADEGVALVTGQTADDSFVVADSGPLRVMVVWTDAAAAAGAPKALVNDLDLVVVDPVGRAFRGNAFVGNGVPPNQGSADRVNVEEAVFIDHPLVGAYQVSVVGSNVPMGPQPFALVAVGSVQG